MSSEVSYKNSSASSSGLEPVKLDDKDVFSIQDLPVEILKIILNQSGLSDLDKARAGEVCPQWSRLVEHRHHPEVTVYGKTVWEENFGFHIKDKIPLTPSRVKVLETLHLLEGKLEKSGCMLVLIPKGLTFNKLKYLMANPKKGDAASMRVVWDRTVEKFGNKAVDQTCWVLFNESGIKESRGKGYTAQKMLVDEKIDSQCALPPLIVAVSCGALKNVKTGKILSPWTFIRCEETITDKYGYDRPLAVGGCNPRGVFVNNLFVVRDACVVAPYRKFSAIQ